MQVELFPEMERHVRLTPREREVVTGILNAEKWDVIAQRLGISRHTVYFHLENVKAKLRVSTTLELAIFFAKNPP